MTKQEYARKYLEDILGNAWRRGVNGKGIDLTEEVDKALLHLTKWGVAIKVFNEGTVKLGRVEREVGWTSYEPLIEEVNDGSRKKQEIQG